MDQFTDEDLCKQTCTFGKKHPKCKLEHHEGVIILDKNELNYLRSKEICDGRYGCSDGYYNRGCSFNHPQWWIIRKKIYNANDMKAIKSARSISTENCTKCIEQIHPLCTKKHPLDWEITRCVFGIDCYYFKKNSYKTCFFAH